jgi:cysteine-rich repeat protein
MIPFSRSLSPRDAELTTSRSARLRLARGLATATILCVARRAPAGLADSPLPSFSDGKQSQLVLRVPGVIKRDQLETVFLCTSLANTPVDIGVELFDTDSALLNDVHAGQGVMLGVAAGQTVTISTGTTSTYAESIVIPTMAISQGSARVVASSDKVRCNVSVVDDLPSPPSSMATISVTTEPTPGARPSSIALPQFSDGKPATHAALFPGAINRANVETAFFCTSLDSQPIDVGVELLGSSGSALNAISSGNGAVLGVAPGETVTIATTGTAALLESTVLVTSPVSQGLARVVSTSAKLVCSAMVLDAGLQPPVSMGAVSALGPDVAAGPHALPQFSDGKSALVIKTIPGFTKRGQLQSLVLCTSTASSPIDIGVEVYAADGTALSSIAAGVGSILGVTPGQTVTIGTSTTAAYTETVVIPLADGLQGSARIVASSTQLLCDALLMDDLATPPVTLTRLGVTVRPAPGALPASKALPSFQDGHAATHASYFPGTIKRGDVETDFFCTSLAAGNIDIGVQVFGPSGVLANNVSTGNGALLQVGPGETVTFGTTGTASLLETTVINLAGIAQGFARVVSDSADLVCSAMVLDAGTNPPVATAELIGYGAVAATQVCGNGTVESPEECDDGDTTRVDGEGCSATCTLVGCGDPNDNGTIAAADALFTLRAAVGSVACDACVCNVDGSTTGNPVSSSDALRVLRIGVGTDLPLLCPSCG